MLHTLQKGENVALNALNELLVSIEWQIKNSAPPVELDVSAFLLNGNKVISDADFIFYNQPRALNNAVLLKENRFKVTLNKLSADINRIAFVLSIDETQKRQHNFSFVNSAYIRIHDFSTKQEIINYHLNDASCETAIILAAIYRHQDTWKVKSIGQGYEFGLSVLARNFGVDIDSDSTSSSEMQPDIHSQTKPKPKPKKEKSLKSNAKPLDDSINIHDTDALTLESQYEPIVHWFKGKFIAVVVASEAMDTSGFFDEVAVALGDDYEVLKIISNKIKHRQINNKDRAYIELADIELENSQLMKKFCKELYDYSFVAKYFFNQQKKLITLYLQSAPKIARFFNGEWLEWYVFMKIVDYCHSRQLAFSCTRNMRIDTMNGHYEIDVFFLINNTPLFIECKSGEYRQFIDKYCKLRKQLAIDKSHFLFLIADMNDTKTKGLTAMFDITFLNVTQLEHYLAKIV
jgi:stress response protein SCP2